MTKPVRAIRHEGMGRHDQAAPSTRRQVLQRSLDLVDKSLPRRPGMNLAEKVATYCAAWDEHDPIRRRELLVDSVAEDAVYVDPTIEVSGVDALVDHISAVSARYPGSWLEILSGIDEHHGLARFGWRRMLADGTALSDSVDVVEIAEDGRLWRIVGFFGPLPPRDTVDLGSGSG
jgi:hypothetical protein